MTSTGTTLTGDQCPGGSATPSAAAQGSLHAHTPPWWCSGIQAPELLPFAACQSVFTARNNLRNAAQVKHFICFQGLLVALFLNCNLFSAPVVLLWAALQVLNILIFVWFGMH